MQIGVITPIKLLPGFCTTDIVYYLPGLVEESKELKDFLIQAKDKDKLLIADCKREGWKKEPEVLQVVLDSFRTVCPDTVILPSIMFNYEATYRVLGYWVEALQENFKGLDLVGSLEGTLLSEIEECKERMEDIVPYIALPEHLYPMALGKVKADIYIENHSKFNEVQDPECILVTSIPIRLGLEGRFLNDSRPWPKSLDWKDQRGDFFNVIERNIKDLLDYYKE